MSRLVLDSYALLAAWRREEGAIEVYRLLMAQEHNRWMSVVNLGEVFYKIARAEGVPRAEDAMTWVGMLPLQLVDVNRAMASAAAMIKTDYTLAYAVCFAAALARHVSASVVTGDTEFEQLEENGVVTIEWLPAKPKKRVR
jgi:PIN domain nuclease of toxin-antitoxin system